MSAGPGGRATDAGASGHRVQPDVRRLMPEPALAPQRAAALRRVAVVIPIAPGERCWRGLVAALDQLAPEIERRLVFARGDLQARPRTGRWTDAKRGRARQQNAGAAGLDREWLWFLRADSQPVHATIEALAAFLARGSAALGYFDLKFLDDGPRAMRLTEWGARWRCRWIGVPLGDQGLLLPRAAFYELGGFDESRSSGEDHALVWEARRHALPVERIAAPLYASARRYAEQGWLKTTWNQQRLTWRQAIAEARRP